MDHLRHLGLAEDMTQQTAQTTQTRHTTLVLGATGRAGRRVVSHLRGRDTPVRAASRSGEFRFDWADRATWTPALRDVGALFLVVPGDVPVAEFLGAAVAAGTRRVVLLSGRGAQHIEFARAVETTVQEAGVEWSIIRPNNFTQNFSEGLLQSMVRAGEVALPIGEVPEPFIDAEDIGEVAATLLTADGHHGQTYELTGPAALTWKEATATIGAALGREIRFADVTPEEYRARAKAVGMPEHDREMLHSVFDISHTGLMADVDHGVRQVLGREATDFATFAKRAAAAGAWN